MPVLKLTPLTFLLILVVSCREESAEHHNAILRYLDETEGQLYNLEFTITDCEYLGPVTVADSARILGEFLQIQRYQYIGMFRDSVAITERETERLREAMKYTENPEWIEELEKQIAALQDQSAVFQEVLERYQAGYERTALEKDRLRLSDYEQRPEQEMVLAHHYRCQVTMQNPTVSNIRREKTQEFLLTPDKQKVIR